jgi:hypothetical protein
MHLSVVGHLRCFHNLAIVNSAAINMGVQVHWRNLSCIPLCIYQEVGLGAHKADLCFACSETSILFSIVIVLACIPISS